MAMRRVKRRSRSTSGGACSSSLSDSAMRPTSLAAPMRQTTPSPLPSTMALPACTRVSRSPSGVSSSSFASASFGTASDSPVSMDSSACRLPPRSRRMSAGTESPASSSTTSPGTSSSLGTSLRPVFLPGADAGVQCQDGEDEECVVDTADGQRDAAGDQQDVDQRVAELAQHHQQQPGVTFPGQLVRAELLQPFFDLVLAQTLPVALQPVERLVRRERMPGCPGYGIGIDQRLGR